MLGWDGMMCFSLLMVMVMVVMLDDMGSVWYDGFVGWRTAMELVMILLFWGREASRDAVWVLFNKCFTSRVSLNSSSSRPL